MSDLHEILRDIVEELTVVFKKPGAFRKFVTRFWKLRILPDETKDRLLDKTRGVGEDDNAHELHSVLYKLAKVHKDSKDWQLSFFTFLVEVLNEDDEGMIAGKIIHGLSQKQITILPKHQPTIPVPETSSRTDAPHHNSAPAFVDTVENMGYETLDAPETGSLQKSAVAVQRHNIGPANIVAVDSQVAPFISSQSAPTNFLQNHSAHTLSYNRGEENFQQMMKRTESEEVVMVRLRRSSAVEIDISAELRRLLQERDNDLLKFFRQREEKDNEQLRHDKLKEENLHDILQMKRQEHESFNKIELILKNLEMDSQRHLSLLSNIEKKVEENNRELHKQQETGHKNHVNFLYGIILGFMLSVLFFFIYRWGTTMNFF